MVGVDIVQHSMPSLSLMYLPLGEYPSTVAGGTVQQACLPSEIRILQLLRSGAYLAGTGGCHCTKKSVWLLDTEKRRVDVCGWATEKESAVQLNGPEDHMYGSVCGRSSGCGQGVEMACTYDVTSVTVILFFGGTCNQPAGLSVKPSSHYCKRMLH